MEEFFKIAGSTENLGQHGAIRQKKEEMIKATPPTGNAKKKDKERRCRFLKIPLNSNQ